MSLQVQGYDTGAVPLTAGPTEAKASAPLGVWRSTGLILGVVVLVSLHLVDPPEPITSLGMGRLGLLAFAIIWWMCAPFPLAVTTFAALAIGVGTGVLTLDDAFAASTYWVMWFAVGAFGLSAALEVNGFNRRFALWFVNLPWLRGRPFALLFMFLLSAGLMSAVMSNTVVTVVWLSLAATIYKSLGLRRGDPFPEINTLGIAWLANIGGLATPIGTPGNAVTIGMVVAATGTTIGFAAWTFVGTFAYLLLVVSSFLVIRYIARPDVSVLAQREMIEMLRVEQANLGPPSPSEYRAVAWFGIAIALWFVPDLLRLVLGRENVPALLSNLGLTVPALLIPVAMCLTPVRQPGRTRVLTWEEWSQGVDWGMSLFLGGVLAIGTAVEAGESGVSAYLQTHLEPVIVGLPEYAFVFALITAVIFLTNLMSNLVTTAIFVPLGITLSASLGIGHPAAIGVLLGMSASLAYALPSGTTTNAIVAGSGWIGLGLMLRYGVLLMVLHALLMTGLVYPFAKLILS
jgi:sodium-dependent dicarboxylate transporter 2/3/5